MAHTLLCRVGMDAAEFDRLVARARIPRLIAGIYNYCDGRCVRCPFTQRCLSYLDSQELKSQPATERSLADTIGDSLRQTFEMLAEAARRSGVNLDAPAEQETEPGVNADLDRHRQDLLAV